MNNQDESTHALEAIADERDTLPDRTGQAIDKALQAGLTWRAIGKALRITHPAAIKAHRKWRQRQ